MSEWSLKRFWKAVSVEPEAEGFAIRLDGRQVRTPAKRLLTVPTRAIADRIAGEWEAQEKEVRPDTMPWTHSANAAIDKVAPQRKEVMAHLIGYAETDLLCYRAEGPESLVLRQQDTWDPLLAWLLDAFGVDLVVTRGVMPVAQESRALKPLMDRMALMSDFELTGYHDMVTVSGSFTIALAAAEGAFPRDALWEASRLDETWQSEQWGEDFEAKRDAELKREAFLHATELFSASDRNTIKH